MIIYCNFFFKIVDPICLQEFQFFNVFYQAEFCYHTCSLLMWKRMFSKFPMGTNILTYISGNEDSHSKLLVLQS